MERRHSIAQDATGMVFFLNLCFHAVVADHITFDAHTRIAVHGLHAHKLCTFLYFSFIAHCLYFLQVRKLKEFPKA